MCCSLYQTDWTVRNVCCSLYQTGWTVRTYSHNYNMCVVLCIRLTELWGLKPNKNVLFSVSDWTVRTFRDVCIVLCSQTARTVRTYSHIIMYVCYFLYQSAWSVRQRRPRPCRKLWRKAFSQGNSSHREPLKWKNWNDILHLDCCTSLTALQVSGRNKQPKNRTKMCYQIIKTCVIRL